MYGSMFAIGDVSPCLGGVVGHYRLNRLKRPICGRPPDSLLRESDLFHECEVVPE